MKLVPMAIELETARASPMYLSSTIDTEETDELGWNQGRLKQVAAGY